MVLAVPRFLGVPCSSVTFGFETVGDVAEVSCMWMWMVLAVTRFLGEPCSSATLGFAPIVPLPVCVVALESDQRNNRRNIYSF